MLRFFFFGPLRTLIDWPSVQGTVAFLATLAASVISEVIECYKILLNAQEWLVLGAATMFVLDLLSGLLGIVRYDHITFSAAALKRSGFKAVEWGFIIVGSVILAGAAREQGLVLLDQIHVGAIFWLMTTDFISMLFNLKGSDGRAMLEGISALARGDIGEFLSGAKDAATEGGGTGDDPNGNGQSESPESDTS